MVKDERFKKFCLASMPEEGNLDQDPVCLEGGLRSGAKTLANGMDVTTMTQEDLENNLKALMKTKFWEQTSTDFDKKLSEDNFAITHIKSMVITGGPLRANESFKYENTTHLQSE